MLDLDSAYLGLLGRVSADPPERLLRRSHSSMNINYSVWKMWKISIFFLSSESYWLNMILWMIGSFWNMILRTEHSSI